jgi:hypothetical protein
MQAPMPIRLAPTMAMVAPKYRLIEIEAMALSPR